MVYREKQLVEPAIVDRRLDNYLFEKQYQIFLDWWRKNSDHFSTFSFNIYNQAQQFFNDLENGVNFETAFLKIRSDLWGYYLEYIKQESLLPFTNRIKDRKLVGDFYGDKPIVNLVNEVEREGATRVAMIDLEERLKIIQPGQFLFRVSPKGWTNMGYDYTETQFQVFWRQDNELIRGLTIRTGVDLDKIIELFRDSLEVEFQSQADEKELLKKITATNVVLEGVSLDEIMEMIIETSGNLDHQKRNLREQYQQWQLNDSNYQRYDQLVGLLNFLELKIKMLLYENHFSKEELGSLLGFALMAMGESELRKKIEEQEFLNHRYVYLYYSDSHYPQIDSRHLDQVFFYLKSLPGCAGGGLGSQLDENISHFSFSSKLTPFGIVHISPSQESDIKLIQCVFCPGCKNTVDAEIIEKNGEKVIRCKNCGAEGECPEDLAKKMGLV